MNPKLHFLLTTIGRKTIFQMIESIVSQFDNNDSLTIIYDGIDIGKTFDKVLDYQLRYKNINIIMEEKQMGFWSHPIRNKYNSLEGDFILHCDDDDMYLPDSIKKIKSICNDTNKMYLFKFINFDNRIIGGSIEMGNIGSPSGIIPKKYNDKSQWVYNHEGDYMFYKNLPIPKHLIEFRNEIIYIVRP